jgi:hypothetical protein
MHTNSEFGWRVNESEKMMPKDDNQRYNAVKMVLTNVKDEMLIG